MGHVTRGHTQGIRRRLAAATVTVVVCAMAGAGCARSRPAVAPPSVALAVPPPPPRVVSTPPEPVLPTEATTVDRPTPANRPARNNRPAAGRSEPRTAEPASTDGTPDAAAAAPEPTAPTGPLLRTPQTADEQQAERSTREVMDRAKGLLDQVNAATLAPQARQQVDTARRFLDQADGALRERNYVLASYLADKAETLAKGLSR